MLAELHTRKTIFIVVLQMLHRLEHIYFWVNTHASKCCRIEWIKYLNFPLPIKAFFQVVQIHSPNVEVTDLFQTFERRGNYMVMAPILRLSRYATTAFAICLLCRSNTLVIRFPGVYWTLCDISSAKEKLMSNY